MREKAEKGSQSNAQQRGTHGDGGAFLQRPNKECFAYFFHPTRHDMTRKRKEVLTETRIRNRNIQSEYSLAMILRRGVCAAAQVDDAQCGCLRLCPNDGT